MKATLRASTSMPKIFFFRSVRVRIGIRWQLHFVAADEDVVQADGRNIGHRGYQEDIDRLDNRQGDILGGAGGELPR